GLVSPTAGEVLINCLDAGSVQARRGISYLPQRVAFPEMLTAREILDFYCRLRKLPLTRADQALAAARFNGFGDKPIREFSGGMVQRLGIALLALVDAPALLLDEPTTGLDPQASAGLRELLVARRNEGKTVVLTSHLLSEVEELADRVAILVQGKLVAVEPVRALRQHLLGISRISITVLNPHERWLATARRSGAAAAELTGSRLLVTARPEDRLRILQALEAAGARIERFATEEPSLEDVYLRYVYENVAADTFADDCVPVSSPSARVH